MRCDAAFKTIELAQSRPLPWMASIAAILVLLVVVAAPFWQLRSNRRLDRISRTDLSNRRDMRAGMSQGRDVWGTSSLTWLRKGRIGRVEQLRAANAVKTPAGMASGYCWNSGNTGFILLRLLEILAGQWDVILGPGPVVASPFLTESHINGVFGDEFEFLQAERGYSC